MKNFFSPKSVAVVGASDSPGKVGYSVMNNLIDFGFAGKIFPINPKSETVQGIKAYKSILDVQDDIDLAVVIIPPKFIPELIDQCGEKNIDSVVIISAGFKETGYEGSLLEKEVVARAEKHNIRVLGPNCLGIIDTFSSLNASFSNGSPSRGSISFFSQSGALCTAILDWAIGEKIGFSKFISIGNKADISAVDMLEALAEDENTRVILGYIEGVKDGRKFMETARRVTKKKPIIIIKAGSTQAGAKAAASHTGTLAGSEKAFKSAFLQSGIIQADSIEELFDCAIAFSRQPIIKGDRIAIVTNAGGPGILAADACEKNGVTLASFTTETVEKLQACLPSVAAFYNPVDVIGDAKADRYKAAVEALLQDEFVDGILLILTPQQMTEVAGTALALAELTKRYDKPILTSFMGQATIKKGLSVLNKKKIPNYPYPERAVSAFREMINYKKILERVEHKTEAVRINTEWIGEIIDRQIACGSYSLGEQDSRKILKALGFKIPRSEVAETSSEAAVMATEIGFPVVMKIVSPNILHKSDIGGVKVGMRDEQEVKRAFNEIMNNAVRYTSNTNITGVSVQQMITTGKEVILGITYDSIFGHMLMFGLGGVYVEVLKDVSFRICPVNKDDVWHMIREIRSFPLLSGVRGEGLSDLDSLEDSLFKLAQVIQDFPQIIEADINPLMVMKKGDGVYAIDARFILKA